MSICTSDVGTTLHICTGECSHCPSRSLDAIDHKCRCDEVILKVPDETCLTVDEDGVHDTDHLDHSLWPDKQSVSTTVSSDVNSPAFMRTTDLSSSPVEVGSRELVRLVRATDEVCPVTTEAWYAFDAWVCGPSDVTRRVPLTVTVEDREWPELDANPLDFNDGYAAVVVCWVGVEITAIPNSKDPFVDESLRHGSYV